MNQAYLKAMNSMKGIQNTRPIIPSPLTTFPAVYP